MALRGGRVLVVDGGRRGGAKKGIEFVARVLREALEPLGEEAPDGDAEDRDIAAALQDGVSRVRGYS